MIRSSEIIEGLHDMLVRPMGDTERMQLRIQERCYNMLHEASNSDNVDYTLFLLTEANRIMCSHRIPLKAFKKWTDDFADFVTDELE